MVSVLKSSKKACDSVFLAVIRSLGSYSRREFIKSTTSRGAEVLSIEEKLPSEEFIFVVSFVGSV